WLEVFFQARLLIDFKKRLTNVLYETIRTGVVSWRLPSISREHEVTINELLPLLHLSLKNSTQIVLLANHMRREHKQQVRFPCGGRGRTKQESQNRNITQNWNLVL